MFIIHEYKYMNIYLNLRENFKKYLNIYSILNIYSSKYL